MTIKTLIIEENKVILLVLQICEFGKNGNESQKEKRHAIATMKRLHCLKQCCS